MEAKSKSPYVAATTIEAIDNINQNDVTATNQVNQGPKHVSFFIPTVIETIIKAMAGGAHV